MRKVVIVVVVVALLAVLGLAVVYRLRLDRLEGYYAPVHAADGVTIYFVHRETQGISWGLGYDNFTAPAHVWVLSDRFSLKRLDTASGGLEEVKRWPASPLEGRHLRHYRGRLYAIPRVRLRWAENGGLEYTVAISLPKVPSAETLGLRRRWNNVTNRFEEADTWRAGHFTTSGYNEDAVREGRELMTPRGPQHYPLAVLAVDHRNGAAEVLIETARYRESFPGGLPKKRWLAEHEIASKVERLQNMRAAHDQALSSFKAQGLSEAAAMSRTSKEMQRLG